MYSSCLYCQSSLGLNPDGYFFPVGRRLAFDSRKGRLWVICRKCKGWNLTPLEERWEAIEECERLFRSSTKRFSTENIGYARATDGLEMVSIGKCRRPEFAAWRYGDQLVRRYWTHAVLSKAGAALAWTVAPLALPVTVAWFGYTKWQDKKVITFAQDEAGNAFPIRKSDCRNIYLVPTGDPARWVLQVRSEQRAVPISGPEAVALASVSLPQLNTGGAKAGRVGVAVAQIEQSGGPQEFFRIAAKVHGEQPSPGRIYSEYRRDALADVRLALEIAAQEESEQRALEGELSLLLQAWRTAEELASIADNLLVPESVISKLNQLRRQIRS